VEDVGFGERRKINYEYEIEIKRETVRGEKLVVAHQAPTADVGEDQQRTGITTFLCKF
jgi:hypothetical protein